MQKFLARLPEYWKAVIALAGVLALLVTNIVQLVASTGDDGFTRDDIFPFVFALATLVGVWWKANADKVKEDLGAFDPAPAAPVTLDAPAQPVVQPSPLLTASGQPTLDPDNEDGYTSRDLLLGIVIGIVAIAVLVYFTGR